MTGKVIPLFLLILILAATLGCAPIQGRFGAQRTGAPEPASPGPAAPEPLAPQDEVETGGKRVISPRIGLCTDLLYMSSSDRNEMVAKLSRLGPRVVRETFRWQLIEPSKGRFEWSGTDGLVQSLEGTNLRILAILMAAPKWAGGSDQRIGSYPPRSPEDYARFVSAVVSQYRGKIKYYELWNEPNIARFWGGKRGEPKDFIALLEAGYKAGKKADPDAGFVMGGVARPSQDPAFIKDVIRLGGPKHCDAVGIHLYPETLEKFRNTLLSVLGALQKAGCSKPIWVTETGWASSEIDLKKYASILAERGISREQARKSVCLRRAVGHVYDFNEEEQRIAQDAGARRKELKQLGITEEELDGILQKSAVNRAKKQAETVWQLGKFLDGQNRVARIFWYRLDDRHVSPAKEANFGLIGVEGDMKKSFQVLEGKIEPEALKSGR